MRSYSTDVITGVAARLYKIAALVERLPGECQRDHREALRDIRYQIQIAAEALQTSREPPDD